MQVAEFLQTVVTSKEGYFCLAYKDPEDAWQESFFDWPKQVNNIVSQAAAWRDSGNVYFSSHLFSERRSLKKYALPSRTLQADLDHADTATLPVLPTVLVQTSPSRHQGFWILDRQLEIEELEAHARRIAYGVPNCDRTGWTAGHKVRLPDTYNHKPEYKVRIGKLPLVQIVGISMRELKLDALHNFPKLEISKEAAEADVEWVETELGELDVGVLELLREVKPLIPARVFSQYSKPQKDRSGALWAFETELLRAGCSREQTFWLSKFNANNKFEDRPSGDRDLRRDVLRAEYFIQSRSIDLHAIVMDLRYRGTLHEAEKNKEIAKVVLNHMREQGEFVHTKTGRMWWMRKQTGRPVELGVRSPWLNSYLNVTYGLNAAERLEHYVIYSLMSYCKSLVQSEDLQMLCYYDKVTGKLLLHTGGRDVLHISKTDIQTHPNGYGAVVFRWSDNAEIFSLDISPEDEDEMQGRTWYDFMFTEHTENLVDLTTDEALSLLRVWLLFLLFRRLATVRPILALLGQQGSGKTTIAHKLYRLIYGQFKSLAITRSEDNYDRTVASLPFVCYDGVDDWQPWLANSLSLSTSDTEVQYRTLWTDTDLTTLVRKAHVIVTAHNPRFTREDVLDRMVIFMFRRLDKFGDDHEILDKVTRNRSQLWRDVVRDIQLVMNTPMPKAGEAPQFRISDFATLGLWISRAAGPNMEKAFCSGLAKVRSGQNSIGLEQDQLLITAIRKCVAQNKTHEYKRADQWYEQLKLTATDPLAFQRAYKSARSLSQKFWTMQAFMKQLFDISYKENPDGVGRLWRIAPKEKE